MGQWGLTTIAAQMALLERQALNTARQRWREWQTEAEHQRGAQRWALAVESCFAALLGWILAWWPPQERRGALALDATALGAWCTVLSVSVRQRGWAIPVAWGVVRGQTPGAWRPHWEGLLRRLGSVLPTDWGVVVGADRGRQARWLFQALTEQGWHPFLRVTGQGTSHPRAGGSQRPLASAVPTVGSRWSGEVVCLLEPQSQLDCTLVAGGVAPYQDPWRVLTDLAPALAPGAWYGLRAWIAAGCKDAKRGGWHWSSTRIRAPERASRCWLVLAVATVWMVSVGGADEAEQTPWEPLAALPLTSRASHRQPNQTPPPRPLSVFRRGRLVVLGALAQGQALPWGYFAAFPWPGEPTAPPPTPSRAAANTRRKSLPL